LLSAKKVLLTPSVASPQFLLLSAAKELGRHVPPSARFSALPTVLLAGGVAYEKAATSESPRDAPVVRVLRRMEKMDTVTICAPVVITLGRTMPHAGGPLPQRKSRRVWDRRPWQQVVRG
jgi:hypothetical protein